MRVSYPLGFAFDVKGYSSPIICHGLVDVEFSITDQGLDERSGRKNDWQSQLMQLKRRSMKKDSSENMSWGARVRKQRSQSTKSS